MAHSDGASGRTPPSRPLALNLGRRICSRKKPRAFLRASRSFTRRSSISLWGASSACWPRLATRTGGCRPVIHVAGTNGKGSAVAFLKAMLEAAGYRTHAFISPHLRRFHERIMLAGPGGARPIGERHLVDVLSRAEAANAGQPITFFEITTAAAFLAFAENPADVVLLETGLGGRLDATNVIDEPLATILTPISLDHCSYLGDTIEAIAFEKAGIIKRGRPVIVSRQPERRWMWSRRARALLAPRSSRRTKPGTCSSSRAG